MKNKKIIFITSILLIFILLVGVTYAAFTYFRAGTNNNKLIAGDIYMKYKETTGLTLENAMPTDTYDPTKYFEFEITGKNTNTEKNIVYDINLNYGDNINNKIRIKDRFLKFRLVEVNNNVETELLTDKSYLSINNKRIYVSTIPKETNNEITKTYRLYCWIDRSVVIGNAEYADYSVNDWNNVYGSVKVNVTGDFSEKVVETEPYLVMKNLNGITDWTNIRANITSIEFHDDGVAINNSVATIDVTDETSNGEIKLYAVDDGLGNNTYKAIVVGDNEIYAPVDSGGIFNGMSNLILFNSKNFKVDNSTNFNGFFANCSKLENVDSLSSWKTSLVTNMRQMFINCISLKNVDGLLNWNTSSLTTLRQMFYGCTSLQNVNGLANFNVEKVEDMQYMFFNCTNLVNIRGLSSWTTSKLNNLNYTFSGCSSLESLNGLSNFDISKVTSNLQSTFNGCSNLTDISALSNWNTENVLYFVSLFSDCSKLNNISALTNWNVQKVSYMNGMFENCSNLTNVDALLIWTTSSLTSTVNMFLGCEKLSNIDGLSNWNTSKVTNMSFMFSHCTNLTDVSATSNWNTSKVQNMQSMFNHCSNLTNINLSSFDMSKVTNNKSMFANVGFSTLIMPNNYKRIDNFMFNHNKSYTGESFTIPKSVTTIGNSHIFYDFGQDNTFNKFIVESGNTSFKTIDDVLYSYDGTRLISIPRGKTFTNNTYEMPEGITSLNTMSFSRTQKIDKVVLPNSYVISRWYDDTSSGDTDPVMGNSLSTAIYVYTSVKEYAVKADNPNYSSDSGCIYSKDGSELIAVPVHYNGVLNIKSGTTTIGQEAFWKQRVSSIDSITQINIPASVTTIEANQLSTLNSLMSRSTNPVTITIDSGNTSYQIVNNQIVAR